MIRALLEVMGMMVYLVLLGYLDPMENLDLPDQLEIRCLHGMYINP